MTRPYIKKKFRTGALSNRIDDICGGYERLHLYVWQRANDRHETLSSILDERKNPSARDWFVANTIIQWLGTNVGRSLHSEVESLACRTCGGYGNNGWKDKCKMCKGSGLDSDGDGRIRGVKIK